jgi:hypothetical protein
MNIKRLVALGSVAIGALLIMGGAVSAGTYGPTGFETPNFTTTFDGGAGWPAGTVGTRSPGANQDGWHSAVPGDIPALPTGYDQQVVNNSTYGGQNPATADPTGPNFGTQSLRVSNYLSEKTGEFYYQTYSAPTPDAAGEGQTNTVFDGSFDFISTSPNFQDGLQVSVSPDNGSGGRMSYVGLKDTPAGIDITFYEVDASGNFVGHDVGTYSRNQKHTIRFLIQFVPGAANDILRLYVDGVDIGNRDHLCFTTWEQEYRVNEQTPVPVTDSFEFRADNSSGNNDCSLNGATTVDLGSGLATCEVTNLDPATGPHGYLFDNVKTETRATNGPAPTVCSAVGKILPTGTTCQQYRDGTAPDALEQAQYTTKGAKINAVSPGVFFYYTKVSGSSGDKVDMTQENDATTAPAIPIQQGQVVLYDANTCKVLKWKSQPPLVVNSNGTATAYLPSSGDFIIGTKYSPSSLKGASVPNPTAVKYTFDMELNSVKKDAATLNLVPKPVGP